MAEIKSFETGNTISPSSVPDLLENMDEERAAQIKKALSDTYRRVECGIVNSILIIEINPPDNIKAVAFVQPEVRITDLREALQASLPALLTAP